MIFKAPKLVLFFLILTNFIFPQQNQPQHSKKVVGYFAQWAMYARDYNVLDIEADKLTHLMYAFYDTKFDESTDVVTLLSLDEWADFGHNESAMHPYESELFPSAEPVKGNFGDLLILKDRYPHLKILMSLGGWTRSQAFPAIAASEDGRASLALEMVKFLNTYPWFAGFDIDWEFPVEGGIDGTEKIQDFVIPKQPNTPDDDKNLVLLLKKIRQTFDDNGMKDKLLTMAAGNNVSNLIDTHVGPLTEEAHGVTENIFDFCDFITFFGYDFGGNWFDQTCYNAPLYGGDHLNDPLNRNVDDKGMPIPDSTKENQVLDGLIRLYIDKLGAVKDKLIMGVPFYGKIFELADADEREFAQLQRDDPLVKFPAIIPITRNDASSPLPGLYQYAPREQPTYDDGIKNTDKCTDIVRQPPIGSYDDLDYKCEKSGVIEFNDLFIGFKGKAAQAHQYLDLTDPTKVSQTARNAGWERYWDDTAKVPYLFNETIDQFISYDDPQSIDLKVKYALSKELGGVMIWELSQDARDSDLGLLDVIDKSLLEADYNITLNFKDASDSGAPLVGVDVQLKDADGELLDSSTSDVNGQVVFSDKKAYLEYKITYTKDALSFLPSDVVFEALEFENDTTININGSSSVVSISGTIQENSTPITDVRVVLKNTADGEELKELTSTDGNFELDGLISGLDYTLIAEKDYYSFTSLTYTNISTDQTNEIIEGTRNAHTIKGNIVSGTNPIDGVTVTVSGNGQDYTGNTDSSGDYLFADIPAGYNYTVTPTKTDLRFLPSSTAISNLNSDITANFEQNEGYIYGSLKDGQTPVSGIKVQLILNWASNDFTYEAPDTTSDSDGMYFFDNQQEGYKISDYSDFTAGGEIKVIPAFGQNYVFKPSNYKLSQIPANPTQFDFNTQIPAPKITFNAPSQSNVTISNGDSVSLEALVALTFDDGSSTTISSVEFKLDEEVVSNTQEQDTYSGTWVPSDSDFGTSHAFTVLAQSSNGESATKTFDFTLECTGTNCPNVLPQLALVTPANTTINQNNGFEIIPITVTATDSDGTVSNVSITIDESTSNMTAGADNTYTYNFLPSKHQEYPFVITAVDDESGSKTLNETLNIIDSQFVPLPSGNIILGYAHSWEPEDGSVPYLTFKEIAEKTNYNVVMYSFIVTEKDKFTPRLGIYSEAEAYQTNGAFDKQLLIDDIDVLRRKGVPVIASIGGATGHLALNNEDEKDVFVSGVKAIIDEYGFDGVDIDLESESINFEAGGLTSFSLEAIAAYPRLRYTIEAFKELKAFYGPRFILTCAPETAYVQLGYNTYSHAAGSFLPVIDNLRDELDLVMVQLYNTGSMFGLDEGIYNQGTPDFLTAMSDMLITGFEVARNSGINFAGLPASKIMVAIPSCPSAAQAASYLKPELAAKALDYMRFGTDFTGRKYTLQNGIHPNLRGVMTWSINWDAVANCAGEYEFSDSYDAYFKESLSVPDNDANVAIQMYPNPATDKLTIKANQGTIASVKIFNVIGKEMHAIINPSESFDISFLPSGLYIVQLKTGEKMAYKKLVKK